MLFSARQARFLLLLFLKFRFYKSFGDLLVHSLPSKSIRIRHGAEVHSAEVATGISEAAGGQGTF